MNSDPNQQTVAPGSGYELLLQFRSSTLVLRKIVVICCRRRIKIEKKAMVVAAVWGTEIFQFLADCRASYFALGLFEEQDELHQDDLKKRINSSYSSKLSCLPLFCLCLDKIRACVQFPGTSRHILSLTAFAKIFAKNTRMIAWRNECQILRGLFSTEKVIFIIQRQLVRQDELSLAQNPPMRVCLQRADFLSP